MRRGGHGSIELHQTQRPSWVHCNIVGRWTNHSQMISLLGLHQTPQWEPPKDTQREVTMNITNVAARMAQQDMQAAARQQFRWQSRRDVPMRWLGFSLVLSLSLCSGWGAREVAARPLIYPPKKPIMEPRLSARTGSSNWWYRGSNDGTSGATSRALIRPNDPYRAAYDHEAR